jgi:hypothetical protein
VRPALTVTLAAAVLTLAACGSQSRVSAPTPPIPRSVATSLAASSDALAAALRRGDGCAAQAEVHSLERQAFGAVASGRVPSPYRTRLLAAVKQLAGRVPRCMPPPPPAAPSSDDHGKKHRGHPKPKKHDKGGSD